MKYGKKFVKNYNGNLFQQFNINIYIMKVYIVLLAVIILIILLNSLKNMEYFDNNSKTNLKKLIGNLNDTVDNIHKKNLSVSSTKFRTCYPTGSADVDKCFNDLPQGKTNGVYITSVKVGSKSCPWDNGGDPDYWTKIKSQKAKTGKEVWGILNRGNGDALPDWKAAVKCMCLDGKCNDARKGLFSGLLIDVEGKDMNSAKCDSIKDLSELNIPTASVVGNGTCSNYNNPIGHTYIAMCYDGEICQKKNKCLKNIKGVNIGKYMYSTNEWSKKNKCNSYDIYHSGV